MVFTVADWFQVGFYGVLRFQVGFSWSRWGFMVIHGSKSVFNSRLVFHGFRWVFYGFHGSGFVFHDCRLVFMVP